MSIQQKKQQEEIMKMIKNDLCVAARVTPCRLYEAI